MTEPRPQPPHNAPAHKTPNDGHYDPPTFHAQEPLAPWRIGQPFIPTDLEREMVAALAFYGATQARICQFIRRLDPSGFPRPIDRKTLRAHFGEQLENGPTRLLAEIASGLTRTALDRRHKNHVAAAIFILKARGGWMDRPLREGDSIPAPGMNGASVDVASLLEDASPDELAVIEGLLARQAANVTPPPGTAPEPPEDDGGLV